MISEEGQKKNHTTQRSIVLKKINEEMLLWKETIISVCTPCAFLFYIAPKNQGKFTKNITLNPPHTRTHTLFLFHTHTFLKWFRPRLVFSASTEKSAYIPTHLYSSVLFTAPSHEAIIVPASGSTWAGFMDASRKLVSYEEESEHLGLFYSSYPGVWPWRSLTKQSPSETRAEI